MSSEVPIGLVIGQLTVGGAEGQLAELVGALDRRYRPIVYSLSGGEQALAGRLVATGATVRTVSGKGPLRAWNLARLARQDGVQLLHSWLFIANAYAAAARAVGVGCPLITSARNCKVQDRLNQMANRIAFRMSTSIVVNSTDVAQFIGEHYGAPSERIEVVYNGVDAQRFQPAALEPEKPHIVSVGRLVRQKNHELFLRGAARVAREYPDASFTIVGEGPLRQDLERLSAELGLGGRVTFAGERRDVDSILPTATLFWLTSRWEGMPNAAMEALACGLPVIATDVGGVRSLVRDNIEGFVIPSEDSDALVSRTLAVLGNADLRQAMRRAARTRAEEFAVPAMAAKLASLYDRALGRV